MNTNFTKAVLLILFITSIALIFVGYTATQGGFLLIIVGFIGLTGLALATNAFKILR